MIQKKTGLVLDAYFSGTKMDFGQHRRRTKKQNKENYVSEPWTLG
jgi:glycerol kinase